MTAQPTPSAEDLSFLEAEVVRLETVVAGLRDDVLRLEETLRYLISVPGLEGMDDPIAGVINDLLVCRLPPLKRKLVLGFGNHLAKHGSLSDKQIIILDEIWAKYGPSRPALDPSQRRRVKIKVNLFPESKNG